MRVRDINGCGNEGGLCAITYTGTTTFSRSLYSLPKLQVTPGSPDGTYDMANGTDTMRNGNNGKKLRIF